MNHGIKTNVRDVNIWKRAFYMGLCAILYALVKIVIWAVVIFQFLTVLVTGVKNERLVQFGQNLATCVYQIMLFLTINTEEQPFPFEDWPDGPPAKDLTEPVASQPEQQPERTSNDNETGDQVENDASAALKPGTTDEAGQATRGFGKSGVKD